MVSKCVFLRLWRLPDPLMASVYPDVVIVQSQRADEGSGVPVKQPLRPLRPITTVTLVREVRDRPTDLWRSGVRRVRDRPTDPGPGVHIFGWQLGKHPGCGAEVCFVGDRLRTM